jgi:membrane-bound inhibitor of C-type lysozyme
MTLAQTISADGARYANFDESFVFWGKGNGALVLEGGEEKSFVGCTTHTGASVAEPHTYTNSAMGFSLRLPAGYTTNVIDTRGDVVLYSGIVRFAVPAALVQGTNLGADTYLSVEEIPGQQTCEASAFFFDSLPTHTVTDNGVTYSVASSSDAGAGNRYNETVYALRGTRSCLGVRYHIHYSVFENYPAGTVKKFDEPALIKQFDAIRRTLVVTK